MTHFLPLLHMSSAISPLPSPPTGHLTRSSETFCRRQVSFLTLLSLRQSQPSSDTSRERQQRAGCSLGSSQGARGRSCTESSQGPFRQKHVLDTNLGNRAQCCRQLGVSKMTWVTDPWLRLAPSPLPGGSISPTLRSPLASS